MNNTIKCTEPDCNCTVGWIETNPDGEKVFNFNFGGRHHGKKHVAKFTEKQLLEKIKEA